MPVHFGVHDGSDPMVMLSPLNQPSRAVAQRRKLQGARSLPALKHPAQQLDFTQLKSGKSPKGTECFSPTSNSSSSAGGMRPRKVIGDPALDRSEKARRPSRQQVTLPSLQGGHSPKGSRQPEARGQPSRSSSVPGRGTPMRALSPTSSPKNGRFDERASAREEGAQQAAEAHALHEISSIAHSITGDLDKIMQRCDELGQDHAGDVSVLQNISSISRRICEDLDDGDSPDQAATEEPAKPAEPGYDDDTLANARKIVQMTNQLCSDLDGKSLTLESKVHDTAELSALQEISSVTKQVFEDMCKLQEEGWAVGVLASIPSGEDTKEDKLLMGGTTEQGGKQDADEEMDDTEMPMVAKMMSERPNSAPNGAFTLPKVEGLPDIAELTARGGDDGFSEAYVNRVQAAFKRFQVPDSADCHVGDLCDLLQYLGHVIAKKEQILPLVREVTSYDYLDFEEFLRFMERYLPWERQQFLEVFDKFDEDQGGEISILELKELLKHLGFIPLRGMLREALMLVDDNQSGSLDFEELLIFLAVYRRAEGFSQNEVAELRKIFDRFTKQEGGVPRKLLPAEALCDSLVQVFGLHVSEFAEKLEEQLKSGQGLQKSSYALVEAGKSESLTFAEFLIFARKTREAALEKLQGTFEGQCAGRKAHKTEVERVEEFEKADLNGDGMISLVELRKVLVTMGYTPLTENVNEVLEDVDTGQDNLLDFHDFFDFIFIYRQREGFRRDEVQEMRRLFERFDGDDSGEISAMELKELFRHMGYRVTMDQVHLFVAQVDENNSNCLDFREYLRLMQLHREAELRSILNVFNTMKDTSNGLLAVTSIDKAFKGLKQEPPKALPKFSTKGFDFDGFVKLVDSCRSDLVARERKKAGFTDERIAELQEVFGRFDKDGSGEIDNMELMGILTEFGWNPKTQQEQQELMRKLQVAKDAAREADPEHNLADDGIEFWTFVQLSRMLETEHEQAEEELMNRLMKELNFNQKEVDDFRQIFMNKKHEVAQEVKGQKGQKEPDGLPRDDVRRLVRSLGISLIGENKVKLDTELKKVGCDDNKPLDFPGFLQLMRWIMTADMASAVTQARPESAKK